jgi:ankyrin repeat protein
MCEIVKDLQRISSIGKATNVESDSQIHAAAAAYQLALCYIQGLGCDISYTIASNWLVFSADLGYLKARRDLYRLTETMGIPIPSRISPMVLEWTLSNANLGIEQAYEDLLVLDPKLASAVDHQMRTIYGGLGFDIFTPEIRNSYSLDDPETFISRLTSANELIPFESIDGEGLTWLHYGASIGSLEAIRHLIERPLDDINCTTSSGSWTPLWMACAAGNLDVALFLLKAGADPKIPSDAGQTCLHHLQAFPVGGVEEITAKLLKAGANIEAKDHDKQETPLHSACLRTRGPDAVAAVRALMQSGADPCSLARDGRSPIDIAAMKLRPDILHALLSSSRFSGVAGETLKSQVKAQALSALIKQLKVHRLRNGGSRLEDNMKSVLNALISISTLAAYAQAHPEGYHPLQDACIWGSTDMIEPLLSHPDIEVNPTPPEGFAHKAKMNPLFNGIQTGNVNLVKIFLSCGADVTVVDQLGRNILHVAAEFMPDLVGEFIKQLRDRGCDIGGLVNSGTEAKGYTPFDVAVQCEHFDCAGLLLGYGAKYDNFSRPGMAGELYTSLQYASGSRRQLSYLLELALPHKNPSLVVCDNGFTLFHLTAASFDNGMYNLKGNGDGKKR